ncbi:MAG: DUF427 domain-containing protein [Actinomycetota bacterium]
MTAEPGSLAPNGKPYESVWDFPRPPLLELVEWRIEVHHRGVVVVDAPQAYRVLETSQPPAYYVDPAHVNHAVLEPSTSLTFCEWKGQASYVDVVVEGGREADAGWYYRDPTPRFAPLEGFYAFYAQKMERCMVDGEEVDANEGRFYGGWITSNVTGPFKGAPGTAHW